MAQILDMPQLSDTMREGVLRKWRKNEGDKIAPGELLAEVETDKATMDFEAFDEGVLLKRLIADGSTVPVGSPIAIIGKVGEDIAALVEQAKARSASGGKKAAAPAPAPALQRARSWPRRWRASWPRIWGLISARSPAPARAVASSSVTSKPPPTAAAKHQPRPTTPRRKQRRRQRRPPHGRRRPFPPSCSPTAAPRRGRPHPFPATTWRSRCR